MSAMSDDQDGSDSSSQSKMLKRNSCIMSDHVSSSDSEIDDHLAKKVKSCSPSSNNAQEDDTEAVANAEDFDLPVPSMALILRGQAQLRGLLMDLQERVKRIEKVLLVDDIEELQGSQTIISSLPLNGQKFLMANQLLKRSEQERTNLVKWMILIGSSDNDASLIIERIFSDLFTKDFGWEISWNGYSGDQKRSKKIALKNSEIVRLIETLFMKRRIPYEKNLVKLVSQKLLKKSYDFSYRRVMGNIGKQLQDDSANFFTDYAKKEPNSNPLPGTANDDDEPYWSAN